MLAVAAMPPQIQWLRARAIHAYFNGWRGVDSHIYQTVFAFCDCPPQIFCCSEGQAFALLTDWGSVVTWGLGAVGGDSSGVAAQLSSGVQSVVGNYRAFAAVKVDGSVVTWGHKDYGGGNPLKEGSSWDPSSKFFSKFFFDNNSQ